MQILIPLSGFGERFQRAGYTSPKPLIDVESKPMVQHVASLFGEDPVLGFICNEKRLSTTKFGMEQKLREIGEGVSIHPITEHKPGASTCRPSGLQNASRNIPKGPPERSFRGDQR